MKIERGGVWIVDYGYVGKTRPAVVLSIGYNDNERALHTVVAHTTARWFTQYEIEIPKPFLDKSGAFDTQQVATHPNAKFLTYLGKLNAAELSLVEDLVKRWLAIK